MANVVFFYQALLYYYATTFITFSTKPCQALLTMPLYHFSWHQQPTAHHSLSNSYRETPMYEALYRVLLLRDVLVRFLQWNRTDETHVRACVRTGAHAHTHTRRFITEIGSRSYESQEVPQSAICKQRNGKVSGVTQPESEGLRTRVADGVTPSLRLKVWECGEGVLVQVLESESARTRSFKV